MCSVDKRDTPKIKGHAKAKGPSNAAMDGKSCRVTEIRHRRVYSHAYLIFASIVRTVPAVKPQSGLVERPTTFGDRGDRVCRGKGPDATGISQTTSPRVAQVLAVHFSLGSSEPRCKHHKIAGAILPQGANDLPDRPKEKPPPRGSICGGVSSRRVQKMRRGSLRRGFLNKSTVARRDSFVNISIDIERITVTGCLP
jgi:hypothetical protein